MLEGYPETKSQMEHLTKMSRLKFSQVFLLELSEGESVRRLQNRKLDPETGHLYSLDSNPPKDETVKARLIEQKVDSYSTIKKRLVGWYDGSTTFEQEFASKLRKIPADRTVSEVTDLIAELV